MTQTREMDYITNQEAEAMAAEGWSETYLNTICDRMGVLHGARIVLLGNPVNDTVELYAEVYRENQPAPYEFRATGLHHAFSRKDAVALVARDLDDLTY
jgi:hypothetical protein